MQNISKQNLNFKLYELVKKKSNIKSLVKSFCNVKTNLQNKNWAKLKHFITDGLCIVVQYNF